MPLQICTAHTAGPLIEEPIPFAEASTSYARRQIGHGLLLLVGRVALIAGTDLPLMVFDMSTSGSCQGRSCDLRGPALRYYFQFPDARQLCVVRPGHESTFFLLHASR